MRFRPRT